MDQQLNAGRIAARIDRLPLTPVQWELTILTQIAWGIILATDGVAAFLYPFVWLPKHVITSFQYSTLYAFEVGFGILLGDYVMGFVADRFGRRPAILLSAFLAGIFFWPFGYTTNFWVLLLFSVLATIGVGGILATNAVYMSEVVAPRVRGQVTLAAQTTAVIILATLTGLLPHFLFPGQYREFLWIITILNLVILLPLLAWRLPESPRWLEAKGRIADAERVLKQIEDRCRRYVGQLPEPEEGRHKVVAAENVPFLELLQGEYGRRTILLLVAWILGYAGIIYGAGAYAIVYVVDHGYGAGFVFLLGFFGGLISGALLFVNSFIGERVEKRDTALVGAILFTIACFGFYWFPQKLSLIGFYTLFRIGAVLWLWNMYNYTANSFPTRLRAVGTGWTDGLGHLGAWVGPIIAGSLFTATAANNHIGWILMITLPCALLPALLIRFWGLRQREAVLEELST